MLTRKETFLKVAGQILVYYGKTETIKRSNFTQSNLQQNWGFKKKKKKPVSCVVVQHQSSVHSNSYNELSLELDICAMLKVYDSILSDGKKITV